MNKGEYGGLILPFSKIELLRRSIKNVEPTHLAVIVTQRMVTDAAATIKELKQQFNFVEHYEIPGNAKDPTETFLKFNDCVQWIKGELPHGKIIVDISGGLIPTRFGVSMGAIAHNLPIFYQSQTLLGVENNLLVFDQDESQMQIVRLSNPLEKVGLLDAETAVEMFNRRNYSAASYFFKKIFSQVEGKLLFLVYEGMYFLAKGYKSWDELQYSQALHMLGKARRNLSSEAFDRKIIDALTPVFSAIDQNMIFLNSVKEEKLQFPQILDCYFNARRRIVDQRRLDDGVARLYRAAEMIVQFRLKQKSIDSSVEVDWKKLNGGIVAAFCARKKIIPEALPTFVTLFDGLHLLDCYEDPIAHQILEQLGTPLLQLLGARNKSILAHGVTPVREKIALEFDQLLEQMLVMAFSGRMQDADFKKSATHTHLNYETFKNIISGLLTTR